MLAKEPLRHDHWARVRRARLDAIEHKLMENDLNRWLDDGGRDLTPLPKARRSRAQMVASAVAAKPSALRKGPK